LHRTDRVTNHSKHADGDDANRSGLLNARPVACIVRDQPTGASHPVVLILTCGICDGRYRTLSATGRLAPANLGGEQVPVVLSQLDGQRSICSTVARFPSGQTRNSPPNATSEATKL
jgi:hypothetical protein